MNDNKYTTEHIDHSPADVMPHSDSGPGSRGIATDIDTENDIKYGRDSSLPPNHPINSLGKWRKFGILMTLSWAGFLANYRWVNAEN
jgi:hypothetical protein